MVRTSFVILLLFVFVPNFLYCCIGQSSTNNSLPTNNNKVESSSDEISNEESIDGGDKAQPMEGM
jgi:hypothetical protein